MQLHAADATAAILAGRAPAGLAVTGTLDLSGITTPFRLPPDLRVEGDLLVSRSSVEEIGDGLKARAVHAVRCPRLVRIGRITTDYLTAKDCPSLVQLGSPLTTLDIDLSGCTALESLPRVQCASIDLSRCSSLQALPDRFYAQDVILAGCRRLRTAPTPAQAGKITVDEHTGFPYDWRRMMVADPPARHWISARRARSGLRTRGSLTLVHHTWLRDLPATLHVGGDLNLEGCRNLTALPAGLEVGGKLILTGCTRLGPIPDGLNAAAIVLPDGQQAATRPRRLGLWGAVKAIATTVHVLARMTPSTPPEAMASAVSPEEARRVILGGGASLAVRGDLSLSSLPALATLPPRLWVFGSLTLSDLDGLLQLPPDLRVTGDLRITGCRSLRQVPTLAARTISVNRCPALVVIGAITADTVTIEHCDGLERLGPGVVSDFLRVASCRRLREIAGRLPCATLVLEELPELARVPAAPAATALSLRSLDVADVDVAPPLVSLSVIRLPRFSTLPDGLELRKLEIADCPRFATLPAGLKVTESLRLRQCPVGTIPADTRTVSFDAGSLPELEAIEATWRDLAALRIEHCPKLVKLPPMLETVRDELRVEHCRALTTLPPRLQVSKRVRLQGCTALRELPPGMPPPEAIELGGTAIERLPAGWEGVALTWERLAFTARRLFETHTLTADEVLGEPNVEARRVLIERYGLARLVTASGVEVLDEDTDPGGTRRLLRVPIDGGHPYVVLEVRCPSTARVFHLRVPPAADTCHGAAAWSAGFDRAEDYNPIVET
jgi:hypothetical protein